MLRGFRWQLLALVIAIILFSFSIVSRNNNLPITETDTATPTDLPVTASAEPTAQPTVLPEVIAPSITSDIPTFREALVGSVGRLNPLLANLNPVDRDISSLIFEGLTRINEYGEPVASLAKSWVISSDGLDYVVQLRDDVLWQDGIPFGAADVIYTIGLLQSADFPGDPALGAFWRTVEIQLLGDHLVRFRLTQPLGRFLDTLKIGILPEHALRGTTAKQIADHPINLSPIGTGPYQLEALRTQDGSQARVVDLRAAPVYRMRPDGQQGYVVDRLSFRMYDTFEAALSGFRNNEVDGIASRNRSESASLLSLPGVSIHTTIEPTLGVLMFNWANNETRFFREQRVRQALQTALDRAPIIQRVLGNEAVQADSPLFPGSWAFNGDLVWPRPDVTAARQLLETASLRQAGEATAEATGATLTFGILTLNDPKLVNLAHEIASQWWQLNITATVEAVATSEYQSRLESGEFGAALVELSMGESADPDVYPFWDADQYPDGMNYGGVDDRRIAEELERARSDYNGLQRAIRYRQFQRDFVTRAVAIPLYYPLFTYATSPNVDGVQLGYLSSPASRFFNIRDWVMN